MRAQLVRAHIDISQMAAFAPFGRSSGNGPARNLLRSPFERRHAHGQNAPLKPEVLVYRSPFSRPNETAMAERRTAAKLIRFYPGELARIVARAQACGQTSARFIRETALGAIPKARHQPAADPILYELSRIGRSLDQLARAAQTERHTKLAEQVQAALDRHWALFQQLAQDRRRRADFAVR